MKLTIPNGGECFDVPEGQYRATLLRIADRPKSFTKEAEDQVRLVFAIHYPIPTRKEYRAGITCTASLEEGSELREFLRGWRGADFSEEELESGTIDLDALVGQQADLELVHFKNKRFKKPYVHIQSIHPAGTLVKDNPVVQPGTQGETVHASL